jgi:hypothetical protein
MLSFAPMIYDTVELRSREEMGKLKHAHRPLAGDFFTAPNGRGSESTSEMV